MNETVHKEYDKIKTHIRNQREQNFASRKEISGSHFTRLSFLNERLYYINSCRFADIAIKI